MDQLHRRTRGALLRAVPPACSGSYRRRTPSSLYPRDREPPHDPALRPLPPRWRSPNSSATLTVLRRHASSPWSVKTVIPCSCVGKQLSPFGLSLISRL